MIGTLLILPALLRGDAVATAQDHAAPDRGSGSPAFEVGLGGSASLAGRWKFQPGDDPAWAAPDYDDRHWHEVSIPTGFGRRDAVAEIAWYRCDVQVGSGDHHLSLAERAAASLGVTIGKVDSAYEIFAGGLPLGGVGSLPPLARMDYDRHRIYAVPPQAIEASGRLVLALRVWKSPQTRGSVGGPHEGPFRVGNFTELTRRELVSELPALFLALLFLVAGLFHLELYRRRPVQLGYLWFAASALVFAGYSFLRTQWRYVLTDDFVLLKELEYLLVFVLIACFTQLLWTLLGVRVDRWLRGYQWLCVAAGVVLAVTPGLYLNIRVLPFYQLSWLFPVTYGLWAIFSEAWRKNPEARIIALGAIVATAFFVNDVVVDRGFMIGPRLAPFGFAFFVLSLAVSLASQFQRIHEELEALRYDLEQRVEERTRDLVEANRARSKFLASVSHELRTPIHGVMGMAELLAESRLPPRQHQQIEIIADSADKLRRLVDDVLDFSDIDAGKLSLDEVDFALRGEVRQVVELLRPRAAAKGLELLLEVAPEVPDDLRGDPSRLCQALFNLVENALKFTRRGSVTVRVTAVAGGGDPRAGDQCLRLEVRDSGIGIAAAARPRLFQPFTQVDDSFRREFGGAGLGLAITRGLVDLMGGELGVEGAPAKGSTFWMTVPLRRAGGGRAADAIPQDGAVPEIPVVEAVGAESPTEETAFLLDRPPAAEIEVDPGAPRVLVVGDEETRQRLTVDVLGSLGCRGEAVSGGQEALKALAEDQFQLVLMDCQTPGLDGYETARRIRRSEGEKEGTRRVPIVAFIGHGGEWERETCLAAGMDDYLVKPFHVRELAAVLERWLPAAEGWPPAREA